MGNPDIYGTPEATYGELTDDSLRFMNPDWFKEWEEEWDLPLIIDDIESPFEFIEEVGDSGE